MAEAAGIRRWIEVRRAGSRHHQPGRGKRVGRRARWAGTLEDLNADSATAAAWAWRTRIGWRSGFFGLGRCRHREQLPGKRDIGLAAGAGEQAVVTDTVEALRQNMKQEATDELVGAERHGALAVGTVAAIVLVAKGDAGLGGRDEPAVPRRV